MDYGIGTVIEALKVSGQLDETLIIFTSDNGGQINVGANCGSFRGGKQDMYEGGIIVPACAVWPEVIEPGSRSDQLLMTMDIYPTVCEAVGAPLDHSIEGQSFLATLSGEKSPHQTRDMVWVRREGNMRYQGRDYYAFRRGDWKLIQNSPFAPYELYNIAKDPKETIDLSRKNSGTHRMLIRRLMDHIQQAGQVSWQKP